MKNPKNAKFSIRARESSSRATEVVDTWKNWIFSQFSDFFVFADFDYLQPSFDLETQGIDLKNRKKSRIRPVRFLLSVSKVVKIDKNLKILKIEKKSSLYTYRPLS